MITITSQAAAKLSAVRDALRRHLSALEGSPASVLLDRRYAKYRGIGYYEELA